LGEVEDGVSELDGGLAATKNGVSEDGGLAAMKDGVSEDGGLAEVEDRVSEDGGAFPGNRLNRSMARCRRRGRVGAVEESKVGGAAEANGGVLVSLRDGGNDITTVKKIK
jgi:hypothetical protein